MLRFYNTLSRRVEPFEPLEEGKVGLYTCGPTVYDFAHIGNFRAYAWEDLLKRYLAYRGYSVAHVMNITDVDDKTIQGANEKGVELDDYTAPFIEAFFEDLAMLRIEPADHYPRATRHVPDMVKLVRKLTERGHTYEADGSVYFRISSFPAYGKLSGVRPDEVRSGARVEADEYEKEDVRDFVLWKARKEGEPSWKTKLGEGRPGWHIECSAMSSRYLGETFDIHTGGVDNMFPHHENEIAQSEGATGKPFVRLWMHCAHLIVEGEKMSKSLGNFHTLRQLIEKGADPRAIRYLLVSVHYRGPLNFTFEGLDQAATALRRVDDMLLRLKGAALSEGEDDGFAGTIRKGREAFEAAMDDDLNASGALGAVFDLVRDANSALEQGRVLEGNRQALLETLAGFDRVFGVFDVEASAPRLANIALEEGEERRVLSEVDLTDELLERLREREDARRRRDFEKADEIRALLLEESGLAIEDAPEGLRVRVRSRE